jgi:hypothetical protein
MPEMMSWPVSASSLVVKVGSSTDNTWRVSLSLSRSDRVLGSMATEMTGTGNFIFSNRRGQPSLPTVSPVLASFMPTRTAMSPALISSSGSDLFACMRRMRVTRSRFFLPTFHTVEALLMEPEYMRT